MSGLMLGTHMMQLFRHLSKLLFNEKTGATAFLLA